MDTPFEPLLLAVAIALIVFWVLGMAVWSLGSVIWVVLPLGVLFGIASVLTADRGP